FKKLGISTGAVRIIIMDDEDAFELGAKPGDRIRIFHIDQAKNSIIEPGIIAIVDIATGEEMLERGEVGLYDEVVKKLNLNLEAKEIEIHLSSRPKSFLAIKEKVKGKTLNTQQIQDIIQDCTHGNLLSIEKAAFIVGLETRGATDDEVVALTEAMTHSGQVLDFGLECYDKHSTGGVPGNKVSLIIVPIVAAAGLLIPKTSTRAITSPSGTADSFEVLAPVSFTKEKVIELLHQEKAAILWGGELDLAPADNALIRVEKPLTLDPFPLMIASILCKKKALGVRKLVLDIPCGKGTKFPRIEDGRKFANRFKEIASKVGVDTICLLTNASQPVGHAVGPALEAREALRLLIDPSIGPSSLRNKSCELAGILLEMAGKAPEGKGKDLALDILNSGKAYEAMKRIIKAQGGNPEIKPEEIKVGPFITEMKSSDNGFITSVRNEYINRIAKIAGCPSVKESGIEIERKIGQKTKKGEIIFRIYSYNEKRLEEAVEFYNSHPPQILGGMTLERI
ncbi:MAG: AMP phosphorylase, partial [Promethearchaeota archaeon]